MSNIVQKPLNTLTQIEALSQEVSAELASLDQEYTAEFDEISKKDVTDLARLDLYKKLSNKLVKVRTQSQMTKDIKLCRDRVKDIGSLLKEASDGYEQGIRLIETKINEPLASEKARIELIESHMNSITSTLEMLSEKEYTDQTTIDELKADLEHVDQVCVLPSNVRDYDKVGITKEQEALKFLIKKSINQQIKYIEMLDKLPQKPVEDENQGQLFDVDSALSNAISKPMSVEEIQSTIDTGIGLENGTIPKQFEESTKQLGNEEFAKKIIDESSFGNKKLLENIYANLKLNSMLGNIPVETALKVVIDTLTTDILGE